MIALKNAQNAFRGEAERLGLKDEQDVADMVRDERREIWEETYSGSPKARTIAAMKAADRGDVRHCDSLDELL